MPPAVRAPLGPTVSASKAGSAAPVVGSSLATCLRATLVTLVNCPPA